MKKAIIILVVFCLNQAFAQQWSLTKLLGDEYQEFAGDIHIQDDTVFMIGTYQNEIDLGSGFQFSLGTTGYTSSSFFLAKADLDGNILQAVTALPIHGSSTYNFVETTSLDFDSDGNILLTGTFWGDELHYDTHMVQKQIPGGSLKEMFLLKLNRNLEVIWFVSTGSTGSSWGGTWCSAVAVDQNNHLHLALLSDAPYVHLPGGITLEFTSLTGYLVTLDQDGQFVDSAGYQGARITKMAVTSTNKLVITGGGYMVSFDTITLPLSPICPLFLFRYDPASHVIEFAKSFGGPTCDDGFYKPHALVLDAQDNIYLGGDFNGAVDFGGLNIGTAGEYYQGFIVKFNSLGQGLWGTTFKAAWIESLEFRNGVVFGSGGRVSNAADSMFINGTAVAVPQGYNGFLYAVDAMTGQPLWNFFEHRDLGMLAVSEDGDDLVCLGQMLDRYENNDTLIVAFDTTSPLSQDIYFSRFTDMAMIQPTVSIEETKRNDRVSIYPNPADRQLNIVSGFGIQRVLVLDLSGRVVIEATGQDGHSGFSLNSSELPSGTYIVRIAGEGATAVKKLVVQH